MVRQVTVTGAYGFIGRHVARRWAAAGWRVIGMGHGSWSREDWKAWGIDEWHAVDITLETLVTYAGEPEQIVHCAGSGSVAFSVAHPYQDFQRSAQTTIATLEYARLHAPSARIVLLSSGAVYGNAEQVPTPEMAPLAPASPYGVHKAIAEQLCASYAREHRLSVAIVRLFSIYGNGLRKQLLWDACRKLRDGDTVFAGTGAERRDWLHVSDAVELLMAAAEHATADCPIVNGGSGRSASVAEVLAMLQRAFPAVNAVRFSGSQRKGDPEHFHADIARACNWGWQPAVSLEDGIAQYLAWLQSGVA
jgi:UDP-glucose 4-epimerase